MRHCILYLMFLLSILTGCVNVVLPSGDPEIVVEGWIEEGGFPIVILTESVPVKIDYQDLEVLEDYLIKWAKVTISDGEKEVVLVGSPDEDYFPPYRYTTARMRGEAGKTYRLKVEYSGRVETAETTIPPSVPLKYVKVVEKQGGYGIVAGFEDDPAEKNYYRFFSMLEGVDSTYAPSFLGLVDDSVLTEKVSEVSVNLSFVSNFADVDHSPMSFQEDDVVRIRFSSMDEAVFNYWNDFDDLTSLSTNPFFTVNKKIRSNVSSGMGYWAGYGSSYYRVSIADSLAAGRIYKMPQ